MRIRSGGSASCRSLPSTAATTVSRRSATRHRDPQLRSTCRTPMVRRTNSLPTSNVLAPEVSPPVPSPTIPRTRTPSHHHTYRNRPRRTLRMKLASSATTAPSPTRRVTAPEADGDRSSPCTATSVQVVTCPNRCLANSRGWYVRVKCHWRTTNGPSDTSGQWGSLRVGSAVLECEGAPSDGNFGTLKFPRKLEHALRLAPKKRRLGLEEPLARHARRGRVSLGPVIASDTGVVISEHAASRPNTAHELC